MTEAEASLPNDAVSVANAPHWAGRAHELARLLVPASRRPPGAKVVPDPTGRPPDPTTIVSLSDPAYWASQPRELADALASRGPSTAQHPAIEAMPSWAAPTAEARLTLTVEEAASLLGISRAFAYESVRRGDIPSIKIGRRVLVPKAALNRMVGEAGPPADEGSTT